MREPGRITVTNVIYTLLALAALAGLWPVADQMIVRAAPQLTSSELLVYNTMLPFAVLVILATIYAEAMSGLK